MHGADLLRGESLAEQVDRRHLPAEDPLLVQLRRGPNVALVKGLQTWIRISLMYILIYNLLSLFQGAVFL